MADVTLIDVARGWIPRPFAARRTSLRLTSRLIFLAGIAAAVTRLLRPRTRELWRYAAIAVAFEHLVDAVPPRSSPAPDTVR